MLCALLYLRSSFSVGQRPLAYFSSDAACCVSSISAVPTSEMALGPTSNPESNPGPERPVARHPSGIATLKANMCRDHNPSTQKTVGIHWDSCKKRTIPDDPSTHKRPRMFLIYYDDVLKFTTTHINSSAYRMTPASSAIPSTSCTTETGCHLRVHCAVSAQMCRRLVAPDLLT